MMAQTSNNVTDVLPNKFIHLNKIHFIETLEKLNDDNSILLDNFKKNFNNIILTFNGKEVENYMDFLDKITNHHQDYLKTILMLIGETCYIQILNNQFVFGNDHLLLLPQRPCKALLPFFL